MAPLPPARTLPLTSAPTTPQNSSSIRTAARTRARSRTPSTLSSSPDGLESVYLSVLPLPAASRLCELSLAAKRLAIRRPVASLVVRGPDRTHAKQQPHHHHLRHAAGLSYRRRRTKGGAGRLCGRHRSGVDSHCRLSPCTSGLHRSGACTSQPSRACGAFQRLLRGSAAEATFPQHRSRRTPPPTLFHDCGTDTNT